VRLFSGGGWGTYCWREFDASKMVQLILRRDFASQNAAPEGMWVESGASTIYTVYSIRNAIRQKQ